MDLHTLTDQIAADSGLAGAEINWRTLPAVAPRFAPWPARAMLWQSRAPRISGFCRFSNRSESGRSKSPPIRPTAST